MLRPLTHKVSALAARKMSTVTYNIAMIGAGQVNFGGGEGPWNHIKRIEQITKLQKADGSTVNVKYNVVGIADPWVDRANEVLEAQKKKTQHPEMYKNTKVYGSYMELIKDQPKIDAAWVGTPPESHGSTKQGLDVELQFAKVGTHLLVEKPISCYPLSEVEKLYKELDTLAKQKGLVLSVGYMFRYSRAVRKIKEIIKQYGPPRIFNGRYNCAYQAISKKEWWDNDKCGGPIVEQGTHFCDLARYIVGEVDLKTVYANAIFETDALGKLNGQKPSVPAFEKTIPPERRIVRSTAATWKFTNGCLGTFTHGVLLHGEKYETELEVWGDGYRCKLSDPYWKNILSIRTPDNDEGTSIDFGAQNEDVYYEENKTFLEAILNKNTKDVASTYADAMNTYRLTWLIRTSAEENHKQKRIQ